MSSKCAFRHGEKGRRVGAEEHRQHRLISLYYRRSNTTILPIPNLFVVLAVALLLVVCGAPGNTEAAASAASGYRFQQRLFKSGSDNRQQGDLFGNVVVMSGDGLCAAVSERDLTTNKPAFYTYVLDPNTDSFVRRGSKIEMPSSVPPNTQVPSFASQMSMNHNGSVLVVNAPNDDAYHGAVFVYKRASQAGVWELSGDAFSGRPFLLPDDAKARLGGSIAVSRDGKTFVASMIGYDNDRPVALVYEEQSASNWSNTFQFFPSDAPSGSSLAVYSLAFLSDGNQIAASVYESSTNRGYLWILARNATGQWNQNGAYYPSPSGAEIRVLAYSPDGSVLAGIGSGFVHLWRVHPTLPYVLVQTVESPAGSTGRFGGSQTSAGFFGNRFFVGDEMRFEVAEYVYLGAVVVYSLNESKLLDTDNVLNITVPLEQFNRVLPDASGTTLSLGNSVSGSEDGSRVLFGAPSDEVQRGNAYLVTTRPIPNITTTAPTTTAPSAPTTRAPSSSVASSLYIKGVAPYLTLVVIILAGGAAF